MYACSSARAHSQGRAAICFREVSRCTHAHAVDLRVCSLPVLCPVFIAEYKPGRGLQDTAHDQILVFRRTSVLGLVLLCSHGLSAHLGFDPCLFAEKHRGQDLTRRKALAPCLLELLKRCDIQESVAVRRLVHEENAVRLHGALICKVFAQKRHGHPR